MARCLRAHAAEKLRDRYRAGCSLLQLPVRHRLEHRRPSARIHAFQYVLVVAKSPLVFPCIKYWYFPYDVEPEDGPFTFGEYSTQLTRKILDFHYRESVAVVKGTWDRSRNKGHGEGSFRALEQDLSDMDIELKGQPVKANTLVMANVSGFHCRGEVTRRHVRSAIHGAIRMEDCFSVA